ncbi:MAG: hypothetical protein WBP22_03235 [Candidatus Saccharimonas sp.]
MFNLEYIEHAIREMQAKGVQFSDGLTERDLLAIENKLEGKIPRDLRLFLKTSVPIALNGESGQFPRWDEGIEHVIDSSQSFISDLFRSAVEDDLYWSSTLGERPRDKLEASTYALEYLQSQPKLIPIFAHRYMVIGDDESPVISYYGPLDSIIYGNDLADYLHNEFDISRPNWAANHPKTSDFWGELVS